MATPASSVRIGGLALRLINDGLITEEDASQAQQKARDDQISLASYLVKNDYVKASALANCASMEFGIPLLDLDVLDLDSIPISLVPEKLIRQHHALPIQKRGKSPVCSDIRSNESGRVRRIQIQYRNLYRARAC